MKKFTKSALALLLFGVGLASATAAPLTSSFAKDVLLVTETVTSAGSVSVQGKVGPLLTSEAGFSIERMGLKLATVPSALPAIGFSASYPTVTGRPTKGTVLDTANNSIRNNFPYMQQTLANYLTKYGVSSGWFNFKQDILVDVNGVAENWTIYWDFFSDQKGRGAYADARLVSPDPKVLYMVYTPSNVDSDLPSGWAYPGGGTLQYQLRDMKFQPVTAMVTVDVNGAFNSIQASSDTDELKDSGISCLMDSTNAGCTAVSVDARALLDQTGAVMVVADYLRRVEPVFIDQGDGVSVPKMSNSVDLREVTYTGCTKANFHNKGSYGYTLNGSTGRYMGTAAGTPRTVQFGLIQEFEAEYLSPTQVYDLTKPISKAEVVGLGELAIDFVKGTGVSLIGRTDIPGLINFAPLNIAASPEKIYGSYSTQGFYYDKGDDGFIFNFTAKCNATGSYAVDVAVNAFYQGASGPSGLLQSTTTYVPEPNIWTQVGVEGHGAGRYLAYVDEAGGQFRIAEGQQLGRYPFLNGNGTNNSAAYGRGHNGQQIWSGTIGGSMYAGVVEVTTPGTRTPEGCTWDWFSQDTGNCIVTAPVTRYYYRYLRGFDMNTGEVLFENVEYTPAAEEVPGGGS